MDKKEYCFPYGRPITANTLCIVGVCTCLMMKMVVERAFEALGISEYDVQPATEDNPIGARDSIPDIIFCEPLRSQEIALRVPGAIIIEIEDLANQGKTNSAIMNALIEKGWMK